MKKVIMMLAMVLPVMLMAQNRPTQSGPKFSRGEYMVMTAVPAISSNAVVTSPKKSKKKEVVKEDKRLSKYQIQFDFGRRLGEEHHMLLEEAERMTDAVDALNFLGNLGWRLVTVDVLPTEDGNEYRYYMTK